MTPSDLSMLNYILGRLEGLACGCDGNLQSGLLDTCEQLAELIQKLEQAELIQKWEREATDGT